MHALCCDNCLLLFQAVGVYAQSTGGMPSNCYCNSTLSFHFSRKKNSSLVNQFNRKNCSSGSFQYKNSAPGYHFSSKSTTPLDNFIRKNSAPGDHFIVKTVLRGIFSVEKTASGDNFCKRNGSVPGMFHGINSVKTQSSGDHFSRKTVLQWII